MATTASLDVLKYKYRPVYATIAEATAKAFKSSIDRIAIEAYVTGAPTCRANWSRAAGNVEPTHGMKFEDAAGGWWELEANQELRAEMFGCLPTGANMAVAIARLHTFAAGRKVLFQSGKTYTITGAVSLTGDTYFASDGAEKATIYSASQTFSLMTISAPASAVNTTLSASVQINTDNWDVTSATGIVAGMLMEVKSDKAWYHDPRGVAVKGELHMVGSVSGSTVYTRDTAFDGYDLAAPEAVTLTFFNPIKVIMENIAFKATPLIAVGDTTHRYAGLTIKYAAFSRCTNVDTDGCQSTGISHYECYRPIVEGGKSHTSNHWSTGYGVNTAGCTYPVVRHRHFWQCRRGVDFSGDYIPTRHPLVHDCVVSTGGISSEGNQWGWLDDDSTGATQYGFGSHGPCDGATYRNNITGPMHTPYELRGRNEHVLFNQHVGRTRGPVIEIGNGENVDIIGNKVYDGWTGMAESDIFNGASNANARRAEAFVSFNYLTSGGDGYEGRETSRIVIKDNDVQVQDQCVIFGSDSPAFDEDGVPNNLTFTGNKVRFATSTGSTECFLFYNQKDTAVIPTGWNVGPNDVERVGGTGRVWRENSTLDMRGATNKRMSKLTRELVLYDDTATSFAIPDVVKMQSVRVSVDCSSNAAYGCVQVTEGATTTAAYGTPSNLLCNASASLAGTTGTDGNLNLALKDGVLFVENRTGALRRIALTVEHAV